MFTIQITFLKTFLNFKLIESYGWKVESGEWILSIIDKSIK